jgi:predicted nucleic acid-binding protein
LNSSTVASTASDWATTVSPWARLLIDEFRARGNPAAAVNRTLLDHGTELLIVPAIAAGEYLDGEAMVSERRFSEGLEWLGRRRVMVADMETARHYARITANLRRNQLLAGRSQNDLWIAATALRHGAILMTRNAADFQDISGLLVLGYSK